MPESRASAILDVETAEHAAPSELPPEEPFRILILADLSGRKNRGVQEPLKGRKAILIDRDNFDEALEDLGAELKIGAMRLRFRELEDFHPDRIYRQQDEFQEFLEARKELAERPQTAPVDPGRGLLDQIVSTQSPDEPTPFEPGDDLADFIKRSMAAHLVHEDPQQQARVAKADSEASGAMRELLHDRDFQALEAAWRGIWMLARGLETGEDLKLYVFDATLEELVADLEGAVKLLVDIRRPWALLASNFYFGQTHTDAQALSILGRIASKARAPFLAGAALEEHADPGWQELRKAPEARWIGLALPRFLLRMPYGKKTSTVESFAFEEMPEPEHSAYLWGNPSFACAYLLGRTFLKQGWAMQPGSIRELGGLPLHVYQEDGEAVAKPCAETLMTEKLASLLMEQGFMALASLKEKDAVLLVRFQSIADPVRALGGRWLE